MKRYPIKELANDEDKSKLMKSLEKGNMQQVTFVREGKEEKMFVAANPQYKTLDLCDHRMEKQFQGIEKKEKPNQDKSQEKKETQKQEKDEEGEAKRKSSKRRGVGV